MNASTESRDYRKRPLCAEATAALGLAVAALALSFVGVYNPWGALRFRAETTPPSYRPLLGYVATFMLPMILGVAAALLGGYSFRKIERSVPKPSGDGFAFFSIMIGLFAALVGTCTTFVHFVWPIL